MQKREMKRHLVHKFALELFIGRDGFPNSVDFLPNEDVVEAWKACYCLEGEALDPWYLAHLKKRSKSWRDLECKPRHIVYLEVKQGSIAK